jgi:hypothetical protein
LHGKRPGARRHACVNRAFKRLGTSTDCTVRSLSNDGASLFVTSQVGISDAFDLMFADTGVGRQTTAAESS